MQTIVSGQEHSTDEEVQIYEKNEEHAWRKKVLQFSWQTTSIRDSTLSDIMVSCTIYEITAGVSQGEVLGPVLYTSSTADLPVIENITTATFPSDTAIFRS